MQEQGSDCSQGNCCPLAGGLKGWWVWGMFLLLVVGYVVFSHNRSAASNGETSTGVASAAGAEFKWADDLDSALAQAKAAKKPLFVKFGASWCTPCVKMDKEVFNHQDVTAALSSFVAVKVDVDKNHQQARQYGVQGIPLLLVLSPEGKVLARMEGALPPQQFIDFITAARKGQS